MRRLRSRRPGCDGSNNVNAITMKLKVNISTCPNDTFMFDAMLNGRIDTGGYEFDVTLTDIEELNKSALAGEADVTKVSYAVVPQILENYNILMSGSALGRGNGPLLVGRREIAKDEMEGKKVAVPGIYTTANMLMSKIFPEVKDKREYLFSDIAGVVLNGGADAGVLIHEGRFTYREKGLELIANLGEEWEALCGLPLPLGAIAVSKKFLPEKQKAISIMLRKSVEYAMAHPHDSHEYVRKYAQEMEPKVMALHIDLFVNKFSVDLGEEGVRAVKELLNPQVPEGVLDKAFV